MNKLLSTVSIFGLILVCTPSYAQIMPNIPAATLAAAQQAVVNQNMPHLKLLESV